MAQKLARTRMVRRWRANMEVSDDKRYVDMLNTLSVGSVRRHFNPYTDIDWKSPEVEVFETDPRWVLPATDPLGKHPWYQQQPLETQIKIGMWRQANVAKVGLQFESILIRGLMQYADRLPNGDKRFRYTTHEAKEECNHTLMFQELVNRIGMETKGMRPWLRKASPFIPLFSTFWPTIFYFGVLAGEEPIDHIQKDFLRSEGEMHPAMSAVMVYMASAGLRLMPPVSNVMPLPTSARWNRAPRGA